MTITIQQALKPLSLTCFIIGIGIYPQEQSRPHLSILYSLTVWLLYSYIFYCTVNFCTVEVLFYSKMITINIVINTITTIISVIVGLYYYKKLERCVKKLAVVDDTLEDLGTVKIYREICVWSKRVIIGWIVYILIMNLSDSIWWTAVPKISYWGFIISHIINHSLHVNLFVDILFIISLWYIGNRFDKVREHMQYLLIEEEHGLRCKWKKPIITVHQYILYTDNYKRILWTSMHLHRELIRIARELNLIFGKQMTFEMATYFIFLIGMSYQISIILINKEHIRLCNWFEICLWTSTIIIRLYYVNHICENVSVKANNIKGIIHQLTNILQYSDIHKELYQFSLQAIYNPLKFTGMGLFNFGSEYFQKFCITVVMFVIIIAQLKIAPMHTTLSPVFYEKNNVNY